MINFITVALENYVVIGKPERQVRKASHCGSKQQLRSLAAITLLLLVRATYVGCYSSRTFRLWWYFSLQFLPGKTALTTPGKIHYCPSPLEKILPTPMLTGIGTRCLSFSGCKERLNFFIIGDCILNKQRPTLREKYFSINPQPWWCHKWSPSTAMTL